MQNFVHIIKLFLPASLRETLFFSMPQKLSSAEMDAIAKFVAMKVARHAGEQLAGALIADLCGGCGLASAGLTAYLSVQVRQNALNKVET